VAGGQFFGEHGATNVLCVNTLPGAANTEARCEGIAEGIAERGMICPSHWQQVVSLHAPLSARHSAQLLMQGPAAQRPDGLLIWDDNVVDNALAGLLDTGVRVPDDVAVVAQANYPTPLSSVLPIRWLGYDAREALRTAFDLIDQQRNGQAAVGTVLVPPRFEEEREKAAAKGRPAVLATTP
jgi:DNA-binding LacI/PurR family transcriptional regulator